MKTNLRTNISLAALAFGVLLLGACGGADAPPTKAIESQRAGDLVVSLLNEKGELSQGQNLFVLWFRSVGDNKFVDVGTATLSSSMAMPGMAPMTAPIELQSTGEAGKYSGTGEFAMSGAWQFEVRWDGPAGKGSTSFRSNIR